MMKQKKPSDVCPRWRPCVTKQGFFRFSSCDILAQRKLVSFPDFSGITLGRREFIDRIGGSVQENRRGVVTGILKSQAV